MRLCVVGLGLIGASIAAGAKKRGLGTVLGVEPDEDHAGAALKAGGVDEVTGAVPAHADLVIVATPPAAVVAECHLALEKGDVVTDVCGVKRPVVEAVKSPRFVGGHPIAGGVASGPAGADPDLFVDKTVVLTPSRETDPAALSTVEELWKALGAKPLSMEAEAHDRAVGLVSQLPHAIAYALAGVAKDPAFVGRSFQDATRVAGADPLAWAYLLLANQEAFLAAVVAFHDRLDEIADAVKESDREKLLGILEQGHKR